jgi:hypothetical protein
MMMGIGILALVSLLIACSTGMESVSTASVQANRSITASALPSLGAAESFAVFGAGAGVTNQGTGTVIMGDMGTTGSSTMITGFHSATFKYTETPLNIGAVNGSVYTAPPEGTTASFEIATAAAADALTAFNTLAAIPDGMDPGAGQLGGLTLSSGVYKSAAGPFIITGSDLILDANGNSDAVWVFQMASSLIVGTPTSSSSVILLNGAQAKNVFWQVGSAATINAAGSGTMAGTIIARAGITFSTAGNATITTLNGRALTLVGAITMVNTVVNSTGAVVETAAATTPATAAAITVTGTTAANVVPVVTGGGSISVENNGGLVTVTETGLGTINIVNNGGLLTATNTGKGIMTIRNTATGVVTVTNTGNGNITVNSTGAEAVTITHTGDEDFTYPN